MSKTDLESSEGVGVDWTSLERVYQMAFFAAATRCVGSNATISPDFGTVRVSSLTIYIHMMTYMLVTFS